MKNNYTVYMHRTPNGKVYIGITLKKPTQRWKNGSGYRKNKYFYSAICKYGWDNIEHIILFENLSAQEAKEKEIQLIQVYKSNLAKNGYNQTTGGDGTCGYKLSNESKDKIRAKALGRKRPFTCEQARKNLSEALKGHAVSQATKQKLSSANLEGGNARAKNISQYDLNGNLLFEYFSMREAERKTGIKHEHISACITGKQSKAGEYIWKTS